MAKGLKVILESRIIPRLLIRLNSWIVVTVVEKACKRGKGGNSALRKVSAEHPHESVHYVMDCMNLKLEEKQLTISIWKSLAYKELKP